MATGNEIHCSQCGALIKLEPPDIIYAPDRDPDSLPKTEFFCSTDCLIKHDGWEGIHRDD